MDDDRLDPNKFEKCPSCNSNVEESFIEPKYKYSAMGWFWWSMGTTATPTSVEFYCKKCDLKFGRITEKSLIKYYNFYRSF